MDVNICQWCPISEQIQRTRWLAMKANVPLYQHVSPCLPYHTAKQNCRPDWERRTSLFSGASLPDHFQCRSKSILLPRRGDIVSHANGGHQTCLCLAVDWDGGTWFRRPPKHRDCSWGTITTPSWQHFQSNYVGERCSIEGVVQTVTGLSAGLLWTIYNVSTPFGTAISNQSLNRIWASQ